MRIFKYLGKHKAALAVVFVLLVAQAFCDLMLPNYTAQIVDVGIQQSGIEHASPAWLSEESYDAVAAAAASAEGEALLAESYVQTDSGMYELTEAGRASWDELDALVASPLAREHGLMGTGGDAGDDGGLAEQVGIAAARAELDALSDAGLASKSAADMQMEYLLFTGLKMMGFVVLAVLVSAGIGFFASRTGAKIGRELRGAMFAKVMSFSDAEVQKFSAASLITRATNDVQQIQMMSILLQRMVMMAPIMAIGGIIMVLRMNVSMGWLIGVAVAALVAVVVVLMLIAMPKFRIMQKLIDRVNLVSRERLTGVQVVRAFGQQSREQVRFDDASTELMRTQLFTNRVMTFMMPSMTVIMNLVSVAIVWVGAGQIDAGAIQTGDLIAFLTYSMLIITSFLMLSMLAIIAPRADVSAQRIDEVLEAQVSISDPVAGAEPSGELPASSAAAGVRIEFDHVSFRYDDGSECVLRDVSFTAEPGQTCAIIGSTGSGKSTVLKLVERFYDVCAGAVRVDGADVRDMPLAQLRAQFGYVPQRAFLFSGTIGSNVGYAHDDADEQRVLEAIDIAQAGELLDAKPEGLDAEITQGGTNVSGGQRQRLAIARALATGARGFLFDDSFSALDYKTDAALRRALAERLPGKTQLIVAQRIATVMQADKIVVLDEGRVVGQGTHAELLATCPQYFEIAQSQLSPEELGLDASGADAAGGPISPAPSAGEGGERI